ncbi:hypothetical protein CERZMDRAFT_96908 [Cercospora zeae-maydis SCOH1-5]|uniref:Uncharacterized protein n=1 Tax=Cercospora zeae-maydis SCOH1-5 TaxID=717836 RepID=A0A6A6FIH8_9PEZI|nr:hypothetical protein CERZMDRAFT_96908 [Cercospora zeae-maydis SCOH1-5]
MFAQVVPGYPADDHKDQQPSPMPLMATYGPEPLFRSDDSDGRQPSMIQPVTAVLYVFGLEEGVSMSLSPRWCSSASAPMTSFSSYACAMQTRKKDSMVNAITLRGGQ